MNIFELYLDKIKSIITDLSKEGKIIIPETFNGINSEIPPTKFDCDISTNVAMVLSKINKNAKNIRASARKLAFCVGFKVFLLVSKLYSQVS